MHQNSVKENGLCWWLKEMSSAILLKSAESHLEPKRPMEMIWFITLSGFFFTIIRVEIHCAK